MNIMKRQKDTVPEDNTNRLVGVQYATGDKWRNNSRKNEGMEPKQKVVGVNRVSTVDHQSIRNFMDLTLCPQFPRHYNLAALAPLFMMTHSTLQQALLEVCAADSARAMAHGALLSAFPL